MRPFSTDERRARIGVRHAIAPRQRAADVVDAARAVVCLHATDPATVYLSAWARTDNFTVDALDRALYDERRLVRMLAMRRTVFVAPVEDVPTLQAAAADGVARVERKRNRDLVALLGVPDVDGWMRDAEAATLEALARRGEATAQELAKEVPALAAKVRVNRGKAYEGDIAMSSRVLFLLAAEGWIVRARPRGTWISSQHRWASMESWLGSPMERLPAADAQAALIGAWLARYGPGTEADIRWWSGLTAREVRAALATVGAVEVELDDSVGYVLPDDLEPSPRPEPWIALLPSLDPTTMGWQERGWYLGPHKGALFDTTGNAGPTIWSNGRIVGGWGVRPTGQVVSRLLEDIGREASDAVDAEAARLTEWLQAVPVVPRFPTPLARELAMGTP